MSKLSRRTFLKTSAVTIVAAALQACAQAQPTPVPPTATTKPAAATNTPVPPAPTATTKPAAPAATATTKPAEPTKPAVAAATATPKPAEPTKPTAVTYKEAPMLAELVKAGKLPPVAERLPQNPFVCPVLDKTGKYGGTLRRAYAGMSDKNGMYNVASERLLFFDKDLQVRPNVAESWKLNADASEWTFTLRKGMKWSDGQPFTSKDFKWWYDNVLLNTTLTKAIGANYYTAAGGQRTTMKIETPDDFTYVQKFAHPKPLNHYNMAMDLPCVPGHYLAQFHNDLTKDKAALEAQMKAAGVATWDVYYANRADWPLNPDIPVLGPWLPKNPMTDQQFIMERNPYYYQVDKDGNQLPYIDKVSHRMYNTPDVFNMWIVNGEIDYQQRNVAFGDYTLHKTNEAKGGYTVYLGASDLTDMMWINHTAKDPKVAEFFQNKDVRIALSHAINREQINDLIYDGLCIPRQFSPPKGSPQYYEKLTTAYIKYDPKLANELLDKAGYTKKDAAGFRLWKDGSGRVSFIVEDNISAGTPAESETQMVVKNWAEVGVEGLIKFLDRTIVETHKLNNEIDCRGVNSSSRTLLPIVDPAFFLGRSLDKTFAQKWGQWFSDPKHPVAEEPPKGHFLPEMWAIWDRIIQEPAAAKQHEMFLTILDVWQRELPAPGVVGETPTPFIIKNGLQNLPKSYKMPTSNPTKHGYLIPLQTYFWDEPDKHK